MSHILVPEKKLMTNKIDQNLHAHDEKHNNILNPFFKKLKIYAALGG